MPSKKLLLAAIPLLVVSTISPGRCQVRPKVSLRPWEYPTILLTQVERPAASDASPNPGQVSLRVVRIIRDSYHLDLQPGEYHGPYDWEGAQLDAGNRYLLYGSEKQQVEDVLRSPESFTLLTAEDDPVADLGLILDVASLPVAQQSLAAALALKAPAGSRSGMLANFAASILAAGGYSDTIGLAEALDNSADSALSEGGKRSLLAACSRELGIHHFDIPPNLASACSRVMARYLLLEASHPAGGLTPVQDDVLRFAQWMGEVASVKAAFRSSLPPATLAQLQKRLGELAVHPRLRPEERSLAQQMLALVGPQ